MKLDCPVCGSEMKVNMDFEIAKCKNNFCGLILNWSSVPQRVYSTLHVLQKLIERKRVVDGS